MMFCLSLSDISNIATSISAVLSIALLFYYIKQVNAMKKQIKIMEEQRNNDTIKTKK